MFTYYNLIHFTASTAVDKLPFLGNISKNVNRCVLCILYNVYDYEYSITATPDCYSH